MATRGECNQSVQQAYSRAGRKKACFAAYYFQRGVMFLGRIFFQDQ